MIVALVSEEQFISYVVNERGFSIQRESVDPSRIDPRTEDDVFRVMSV